MNIINYGNDGEWHNWALEREPSWTIAEIGYKLDERMYYAWSDVTDEGLTSRTPNGLLMQIIDGDVMDRIGTGRFWELVDAISGPYNDRADDGPTWL